MSFLEERLEGKPVTEALEVKAVALDLIQNISKLKEFPVS